MARFKTRLDGFQRAIRHYICKDCGTVFTKSWPKGGCTHCGLKKTGSDPPYIHIASKKEYYRYAELELLQKAGKISDLKLQPTYECTLDGVNMKIKLDFSYTQDGVLVVEDAKTRGTNTQLSVIKRLLVQDQHGIKVKLV